jgi:hypothetical protein
LNGEKRVLAFMVYFRSFHTCIHCIYSFRHFVLCLLWSSRIRGFGLYFGLSYFSCYNFSLLSLIMYCHLIAMLASVMDLSDLRGVIVVSALCFASCMSS